MLHDACMGEVLGPGLSTIIMHIVLPDCPSQTLFKLPLYLHREVTLDSSRPARVDGTSRPGEEPRPWPSTPHYVGSGSSGRSKTWPL